MPHYKNINYRLASLQVVDLRDPAWVPGEYETKYKQNYLNLVEAHVAVGKTKIFLYHYGDGNILKWKELLDKIAADGASSTNAQVLTKSGNVLLAGSPVAWEIPSHFSANVAEQILPLYEAGLLKDSAQVYYGNWASLRGKPLGTVEEFLTKKNLDLPAELVFYHGTSSDRVPEILKSGLKAVPVDQRAWRKDNLAQHPDWRGKAVYLTVDLYQATSYANKAVNMARRHGARGVYPVVLKIVIPKANYHFFMPDDDFLQKHTKNFKQLELFTDLSWLGSLGSFSQVAYLNSIPPEWISIKLENKKDYEEPLVASVVYKNAVYRLALTPQQKDLKKDYLLQQNKTIPSWDVIWKEIKTRETEWDAYIDKETKKRHPRYKEQFLGKILMGFIDFSDEEVETKMQQIDPQMWATITRIKENNKAGAYKFYYDQLWNTAYAQLSDGVKADLAALRADAEAQVKQEAYQEYRKLVDQLKHLGGKPCWRALVVPKNVDLSKANGFGIFWAVDYNAAQPYYASGALDWDKQNIVIVKGIIDIDYIDWKGTAGARFIVGWGERETEVRFFKHAPIFIEEIQLFSQADNWYKLRQPNTIVKVGATRRC